MPVKQNLADFIECKFFRYIANIPLTLVWWLLIGAIFSWYVLCRVKSTEG